MGDRAFSRYALARANSQSVLRCLTASTAAFANQTHPGMQMAQPAIAMVPLRIVLLGMVSARFMASVRFAVGLGLGDVYALRDESAV